ncbi:MAG: TM0106 family RecB-like putative nuclease [Synechococcaceae cyanobacterium]|nr:TM0106 family RecB-like putative nuclease [Synechococcaceae cyanobacterium]
MPSRADSPPLSDRLLRSWLRCRRRAWLDRHGPLERRHWSAHRALALEDQQRSFQALLQGRPGRGEAAAQAAMPGVVGLRLRGRSAGVAVEAQPSLLERVPGASRWGGHAYRPVLARQGRRLTREHRLQLALWGWLLAEHQQAPVPQALVVAGAGRLLEREPLALGDGLRRQLDEALLRLAADLERPEPPPLVNDRKKCTLCGWRSLCDAEAAAEGHLSEVSGIGGKRRDLLLGLGIGSLAELAGRDPQQLAEELAVHGEQHREVAAGLVAQALVQAAGAPRRLDAAAALPELAGAPGVIVYDIESDPDARDDFLHGLLLISCGPDGRWPTPAETAALARYQPLLALQEHGEARLWRRLSGLLARYPDWPVLHYGETESLGLLRLAERQGASEAERQALRRRLVDVHQRLRRHWLLPVNSYGLKAVAGWRGFRWSQSGADGARCLLWWRQWRRWRAEASAAGSAGSAASAASSATTSAITPVAPPLSRCLSARASGHQLRRILRYNRDDGLATWVVAHWLLEPDQRCGGAANPGA